MPAGTKKTKFGKKKAESDKKWDKLRLQAEELLSTSPEEPLPNLA